MTQARHQPQPFIQKIRDSRFISDALHSCITQQKTYLSGLDGSLKGIFAALLFEKKKAQIIYIAPDVTSAHNVWNDAAVVLREEHIVFIGDRHPQKNSAIQMLDNTFAGNADTLRSLLEEPNKLVITDVDAFLTAFPSQKDIRENSIHLERFASMKQDDLIKRFAYGGFERKEFVESSGDYAVRGGIIDVFPIGFDNPIRIEFFGDEIDSMREFDALSQRSIRQLDSIGLVTSLFLDEEERTKGTMFDYFHHDALLFIDEIGRLEHAGENISMSEWNEINEMLGMFPRVMHSVLPLSLSSAVQFIDINADLQPAFNSSIRHLKEDIKKREAENFDIHLIADSEQQAKRLEDLIAESEDDDDIESLVAPRRQVYDCSLSQGFVLPALKLAVYAEHQIFNRREVQRRTKKGFKGISLRELRQLHIGDYVVHVDKGIGTFAGFQTINVNGGKQETAKIIYAGNDILYVNLNYINRVQKYSSKEGQTPTLSKLGGTEWERAKARTKRRLKDIARDLIQLYAKRKMAKGFAYAPDTHWQREMEASFLYEDTPDQAKATEDVKTDMAQPIPMDRLVCGDVGYGKTEVAVRAAFKAAFDGKQVAVLVPTTILAQQHYNTFQDRLHRYSVHVESLSRFKSAPEQKEIVKKLTEGKIDILIGTHRILGADVQFRDLGLLIIDEEHRFGVAAKEKLRKMREHIDTLTLTATPIPRTLNFSLLGARDLSIMETPPRNRLPIITEIVHYNENVIREGMQREIDRNGQAYFVHDRVRDIELVAEQIRRIVPSVRIGIAHGRMKGNELERVMMRFMERKYDLLVCTKIIESGLDIPNANTIFINRADGFGLAELYQLRGRVGRSNIQAYAFIIIPKESKMSRDALKRLQALEEFTELGTGFQLAMRDMEIRGAGNLLGAEQSGFIDEIGFELYMKMLEETVDELKQEEFPDLFKDQPAKKKRSTDVVMELGIDAYLPQEYVKDATERFDYYKRLYNVESDDELQMIELELIDRFGLPPKEVEALLYVVKLRLMANKIHLARVTWDRKQLTLVFPPEEDEEFYSAMFQSIIRQMMKNKDGFQMEQEGKQLRLIRKNVFELSEVEESLRWMVEITLQDTV